MPDEQKTGLGKSDFNIFSTKKKIMLYFLIIVVGIFFIFNSVFYNLYSSNIKQIVIRDSRTSVKKTSEFVDMILESLEYTADVVQNNKFIQEGLEPDLYDSGNSYRLGFDMVNTLQSIVTETVKSASSIDLYLNRDGRLVTSDYGVFSNLKRTDREYYTLLQQDAGRFKLTDEYRKKITFILDRSYEQITLIRPLYILFSGVKAGVLAVNIDKYELKTIIKGDTDSTSFILDDKNNTIVSAYSEAHNNAIAEIEGFKTLMEGEAGEKLVKVNGEEHILVYETSGYTGWKFVKVVPVNASMQNMSQLRDYILVLFLLMNILSAALLILLISEKVYRRLKKLILSMKEVEKGDFNVNIQHNDKDEFGYMYNSFNNMVSRIRALFVELYQQKLLQKDAELKLLQSKINPHFIYNIFDNMNWLIQLKRYDELEPLVDAVSDYFKKSLNAGKDFISVSDTVRQLKSYAAIQQIRFRNRFTCEFDFDEEIMDMPILNFMLQPLLENAICHGIEPKAETSDIRVMGVRIGESVFFTVKDNGLGISPDKLRNIVGFLESEEGETDSYFALANINKRIKLHYGKEYGLTIKSALGAGTKVTVFIPAGSRVAPEVSLC